MGALVGRERDLDGLRDRLADARRRRGQLVLITGEPGIGKTRLAEEFAHEAEDAGVRVGWGRASEDQGCPPYWVFRQLFGSLGQQLPDLIGGGRPDGSAEARFAAFEDVAEQLRAAAEPSGLVAVLDDLQWADAASLALLVHLGRGLARSRLVIVATYRDTEATGREALAAALGALAHESSVSRIRLVGLTLAGVAQQLELVTGTNVADDVVQRISRRTGGNPFFVAELGRLADRGADAVPDAVLDTVRARLAQLGEPCRDLIATAAVLGSDLDAAALADVTERPLADVLAALDEAAAAGVAGGPDRCRFSHDLIREAARFHVPTARRLAAHVRMAEYLERRPDARARTAEIAHHWTESLPLGDARRASEWSERAADEALDQLAWEDAAALYRRALATGAELGAPDRARLLRREGVAHLRGGDINAGSVALNAAADAAREADDPVALGEIALTVEGLSDAWGVFRGGPLAAEALAALPVRDDPLRARLLALHAGEASFSGGVEAEQVSAEALAMAERLGDGRVLRSALRCRQMTRSGPDGVHERLELATRMLLVGQADDDDDAALWGHLWRFDALAMLGRLDEAEAELMPIRLLADRLRRPLARWHYLRTAAAMDITRGRFGDAAGATQESLELVRGRAHDALPGVCVTVLTMISSLTGRRDLVTDEMFEVYHRSAPRFVYSVHALCCLRLGDRSGAERYYLAAGPLDSIPVPAMLSVVCNVTELATELGHVDDVARVAALLRRYPELFATGGAGALMVAGSVRTYLGMATAAMGRLDDAVRELRLGIEANERERTPPFTALAQFELAKVLARRKRPGDLDEASALAASARVTAERLGMAPLRGNADTLARTLHGDEPGPLTRREREVAEQVAKGLTNKQIAAVLHISERTAESHVQHVLTKLGLANRTQIATRLAAGTIRTEAP